MKQPSANRPLAHTIVTAIFCLFGIGTGLGDLTSNPTVLADLAQLGYPAYLAPLLGSLKLLGVAALLAPGLPSLKEWAYAGFTFDLGGAIISSLAVGAIDSDLAIASLSLGLLAAAYLLLRRTRAHGLPLGLLRLPNRIPLSQPR